jgi:hypothetical protein
MIFICARRKAMRSGRFIGLLAAVAAFVLLFVWGYMNTPQYELVLAANADLQAGTYLADIPAASLLEVKLTADPAYRQMYLTAEDYQSLVSKRAFLTETIHRNEFVRAMAVAFSGNPEQARRAALGMTDPDMRDTILPFEFLPTGIQPGDCVDLAVVTADLRNASGGAMLPALLAEAPSDDALSAPRATGTATGAAEKTAASAPTATPSILLPLGKFVVQCARVVRVIHQTDTSGRTGATSSAAALELILPQESAEMVAMASQAGVLRVFLRPASPEDRERKPSIGASMQDVLDLFYADRQQLAKTTPSPTPASGESES